MMIRAYSGYIIRGSKALHRQSGYRLRYQDVVVVAATRPNRCTFLHGRKRVSVVVRWTGSHHLSEKNIKRRNESNLSQQSTPPPPPLPLPSNITNTALMSIKSFAIGSFAGLLGSLAGMGGGFVMIPLMTSQYVFHPHPPLTQHQAHGTSLFAVAATGLAGAVSYYSTVKANTNNNDNCDDTKHGNHNHNTHIVRIPEAAAIAFTAILTARWGAQATSYISGTTLKRALGYLMLLMAPAVPAKTYYLQWIEARPDTSSTTGELDMCNRLKYPTIIGLGSGFLSGLFGVGGGTIVVPALTLLTDLNHHEALGTSLAAMILPALSGSYAHYQAGNCVVRVAVFLASGALVGAYAGAKLSVQTDESTLRLGFAALLATLGIRTLLR